jgi:hypothetical protein
MEILRRREGLSICLRVLMLVRMRVCVRVKKLCVRLSESGRKRERECASVGQAKRERERGCKRKRERERVKKRERE